MTKKPKTNVKKTAVPELLENETELQSTDQMRDQETVADDYKEQREYIASEIDTWMQRIRYLLLPLERYGLNLKRQSPESLVDLTLMYSFRDQLIDISDDLIQKHDLIMGYDSHCRRHYDETAGTADLMRKEIGQSLGESRSRDYGIPRLLTADDVGKTLGITGEEVNNLADEGKLGHVELTDKKKAYTMDLITEFIKGETYRRSWRWDEVRRECESFG